jgi:hypothetical protein
MYNIAKGLLLAAAAIGLAPEGADAQSSPQTLFKLTPFSMGSVMTPAICNISAAFPTADTWSVSVIDPYSPWVLAVGGEPTLLHITDAVPFNYVQLQNNGAWGDNTRQLLGDCSTPVTARCSPLPAVMSLNGPYSICSEIDNTTNIDCMLFQSPLEGEPSNSSVRVHAKGFAPDSGSFPLDTIVNIQAGKPFNFSYSSSESSLLEMIAISNLDDLGSNTPFVWLSCYQSYSDTAAKAFASEEAIRPG